MDLDALLERFVDAIVQRTKAEVTTEADPWLSTKAIARDALGADDDRLILAAARRDEVEVFGPRGHHTMRRSERDRWLSSLPVGTRKPGPVKATPSAERDQAAAEHRRDAERLRKGA